MGSSGGGGSGRAPNNPAPPASMISPYGSSAPFNPHFISFLGDTNTPSTGLTPEMLAAIDASNGPAAGGATAAAASPAATTTAVNPAAAAATNPQRQQLANLMAMQQQSPERGYNIARGRTSGRNLR